MRLIDVDDIGVLCMHIAEADRMRGWQRSKHLCSTSHAVIVAESVDHGGSDASAGGRARHDETVAPNSVR